jgi:hypothetical protein
LVSVPYFLQVYGIGRVNTTQPIKHAWLFISVGHITGSVLSASTYSFVITSKFNQWLMHAGLLKIKPDLFNHD